MTTAPQQHDANPTPGPSGVLPRLRRRLRVIGARLRLVLLVHALLICLAAVVLCVLGIGVLDYLLRLPPPVRLVLLLLVVGLLVRLMLRYVIPAWQTRLRETDVALIIERHDPQARGLLASAIDLDAATDAGEDADRGMTDALRLAALRTVSKRIEGFNPSGVLRIGVLARSSGFVSVLLIVLVVLGVLSPIALRVGAHRVLTPWDGTRWPVRYAIEDITQTGARAIDAPVPIRALIGNAETALDDTTRAMVTWRLLDENGDAMGEWSRTLLMPQRRRDPLRDVPVYEQLIDARDRAARVPEQQRFTLEYRIDTRDDSVGTRRIALARPPQLRQTTVTLGLPEYARPIAPREVIRSGVIETQQSDLSIAPVLAGTRVEMVWSFSKPIDWSDTRPEWVQRVANASQVLAFDQPDESSIRLAMIAGESVVIEPGIRDRSGIPVRTPITTSLEVLDDLSPSVSITAPRRDERLTPQAVIEINAELSDDLGLTRAMLQAQRASPPRGSAGAPPEPVDEPIVLIDQGIDIQARAMLSRTLDLAGFDLNPGDELRVWATGWDLRASSSDERIGRAESSVRLLQIVAQSELIEQVRRSLEPLRGNLRQLDERQGDVQDMLRAGSPRAGDEQRSLSERLRANQNAVAQLAETVERNNLDDEALRSTLNDAAEILEEAAAQSERADDQIRRGSDEPAAQSQRRVRDRLGELLSMLDQGQDAWLALRNVQQLQSELQSIREDTQELAQRTAGQSLDEMSPDDRSALEQILDRQLQNAEDARQAINTLDQQAQELEENDPTQAEALRRAAQQARAAQLEEKLREAGAQIERNQTGNATQTQEEVLEELQELLEELENTIQNRDNALRRELASIIDSIKGLIDAQERELIVLDTAKLNNDFTDLDARLITMVRNTLSVRDEALGAFPETRTIADHIGRAGNAQNSSISALRANPPNPTDAEQNQRGALQHLFNALEEAQRLDEQAAQRQAQRARDELRKQYEESLDIQSQILDETIAIGQGDLNRRQRAQARALSQRQDELRAELAQMPEQSEGLAEAPVFTLAHAQLDRLMSRSKDGLTQAQISQATATAQRQSMSILASLIEVLQEQQQDQAEDFEDGQSQGGGENGGGQSGGDEPLIPPVAELKLLRSMQQLVADQTRSMSETGASDEGEVRAVGDLQKQLFEQGAKLIERMNPALRPQPGPDEENQDQADPNPGPIEPVENSGAENS